MGQWVPYLKREFAVVFDDRFAAQHGEANRKQAMDYVYLVITESHWDINAVSPAKAVGPYQFMKKTGEEYGLKIARGRDDRKDPIKSARACAEFLKSLFVRAHGDWRLAIPMYNGAFPGRYLKELDEENIKQPQSKHKEPDYDDYLALMNLKIQKVMQEIKNDGKVKEADKPQEAEKRLRHIFENLAYGPKTEAIIKVINCGGCKETSDTAAF
jgi:hypothetical protein